MALETGTYISDLVVTNPTSADAKSQGDDHLRLIKSMLKNTFPSILGAVLPTHIELNFVKGVTSAIQTQLNSCGKIAGQVWDGVHDFTTATLTASTQAISDRTTKVATTEFVGNEFAPINSPELTGVPKAPTAASGTSTTQIASTEFVVNTAFSSVLPAQTGNAGKFIKTDGTNASWQEIIVNGNGAVSVTGDTTLATANGSAIIATPTKSGYFATLPNATTCSTGCILYSIFNNSAFDYGVKNYNGEIVGWVRPGATAIIELTDNTTTNGVWSGLNLNKSGVVSEFISESLTGANAVSVIGLNGGKKLLLLQGTSLYGLIHDTTTNTYGTPVLIRASSNAASGFFVSNDLALVCSCDTTVNFEAVTLSISGVEITVNSGTKATATLSGNMSGFSNLITIGLSFIVSYYRNTTSQGLRAITVSGTTPIIGGEATLTASSAHNTINLHNAAGLLVVAFLTNSTTLTVAPYSVSGSTLTLGTSVAITVNNALFRSVLNNNNRLFIQSYNSTNVNIGLVSFSGTTASINIVAVTSHAQTTYDLLDIGANKISIAGFDSVWDAVFYTVSDNAGTPTLSTAITKLGTRGASQTLMGGYVNGAICSFFINRNGVRQVAYYLDCSSANPTVIDVKSTATSATNVQNVNANDSLGVLFKGSLSFADKVILLSVSNEGAFSIRHSANGIFKDDVVPIQKKTATSISREFGEKNKSYIASSYADSTQVGFMLSIVRIAEK